MQITSKIVPYLLIDPTLLKTCKQHPIGQYFKTLLIYPWDKIGPKIKETNLVVGYSLYKPLLSVFLRWGCIVCSIWEMWKVSFKYRKPLVASFKLLFLCAFFTIIHLNWLFVSGSTLESYEGYIAMEVAMGNLNEARAIYKRCYAKRFAGTGSEVNSCSICQEVCSLSSWNAS